MNQIIYRLKKSIWLLILVIVLFACNKNDEKIHSVSCTTILEEIKDKSKDYVQKLLIKVFDDIREPIVKDWSLFTKFPELKKKSITLLKKREYSSIISSLFINTFSNIQVIDIDLNNLFQIFNVIIQNSFLIGKL